MTCNNSALNIDEQLGDIVDELIVTIPQIESLKQALKNPIEIKSSSTDNTIEHLLRISELNIEENLTESQSFYLSTCLKNFKNTNLLFEENNEEIEKNHVPINSSDSLSCDTSAGSIFPKFSVTDNNTKKKPSGFSIPSINSQNDKLSIDSLATESAQDEINNLENNGPAGTVHLSAVGNVIGRRIIVFSSNMELLDKHEAARSQSGPPIELQYHSPCDGQIYGHWTLIGDKDCDNIESSLNDCLFVAISAQTKKKPTELRRETIQYMKKHINSLTIRIQELVKAKGCDEIVLLIGGAKYNGANEKDAKQILNYSQATYSHLSNGTHGHPRAHASDRTKICPLDSVENYSEKSSVSGFLSRDDQDKLAHFALKTNEAKAAMEKLNKGATEVVVPIPTKSLLVKGGVFQNRTLQREESIIKVVLVLRHQNGCHKNPDSDVFVHTFYPVFRQR